MKSRIISSAVLVALLIAVLYFSSIPFLLNIAIAAISAAALYESLIVTKYIESKALMGISIAISLFIPFVSTLFHYLPIKKMISTSLVSVIFLYILFVFISMLVSKEKFSVEHLAFVFLMTVIIPCFYSTVIYAHSMPGGNCNIIMIMCCSWGSDTGGYIFGRLFGRHQLAPKISPKKTVEGLIGGIATVITLSVILCYVSDIVFESIKISYIAAVIYAVLGAICAVLGDLFASVIKRSFGVKDFGSIIPGHGGIMDRFDSVLFTAPLIYILITIYPIFMTV